MEAEGVKTGREGTAEGGPEEGGKGWEGEEGGKGVVV